MPEQEKILEIVGRMSAEQRRAFFDGLIAAGITKEDTETIYKAVFFWKLMHDNDFYKMVERTVAEKVYKSANG